MNYSVFISGTLGYVAFLYLFVFGTISILFLTTFIKNSGLKYSLPFLILLSFLTMTIYGQFVNVPNVSVYNPIPGTKDFQGFVAMEKQFLNYEKFEKSDFGSLYQKNFDSNISKVEETINKINKINNLPVASDPNFSIYNVFVRNHFFNGQPDEINYNKNHRTISDVYHDLSKFFPDQNLKDFFNCLSKIYSNFELNNMFNIYLLQSNSVNNNYYGFLNSQTYIDKEYNKSNPDKYNMSVDEFLALRFINLANQYSQPIKNIYVNNFKSEYSSFKSELRTMVMLFLSATCLFIIRD